MPFKRGLIVAAALAALSGALLAASANATAGNGSADCALTGQMGMNPAVGALGGSGISTLSATADCVVSDASDGTVVTDIAINSNGSYTFSTCLTGRITDTDASVSLLQTVPAGKLGDEFPVTGIGYTIDFQNGIGSFHVTSSGTNGAGHGLSPTTSSGTIVLVPTPSPHVPAVGDCTDRYAVAGKLHFDY